jgi:hypothetical protein
MKTPKLPPSKEMTTKNKDLVGKNVMQKEAKHRPGPMKGRDAGEHGKKWSDHFDKC